MVSGQSTGGSTQPTSAHARSEPLWFRVYKKLQCKMELGAASQVEGNMSILVNRQIEP